MSKKRKIGRPKIELGDEQVEQVEKLAAYLTQEQIADVLGISEPTLRRRMNEDARVLTAYQRGKAKAIAAVARNLVSQAMAGNMTAAIFFLKTQARWAEVQKVEASGPEGGPISIRAEVVIVDAEDAGDPPA